MKVTLIAHTPNPEKTVAAAAKLCYSASGVTELYDGLTDEKAADCVESAMKVRLNTHRLHSALKACHALAHINLCATELHHIPNRASAMSKMICLSS